MNQKLHRLTLYLQLIRLNKPFAILLVYTPCLWGLAISSPNFHIKIHAIFLIGAILTRSIGCLINDIIDRDIDSKVERTRHRPLVNPVKENAITLTSALIFLAILCSATVVFVLKNFSFRFALYAIPLIIPIIIYPYTKRFFILPQLFLGLVINSGLWLSSLYANESLQYPSQNVKSLILLYTASILWTVIYDTIYALKDKKDDKELKLNSSTILFESHSRAILFALSLVKLIITITALATAFNKSISIYSLIILSATTLLELQGIHISHAQNQPSKKQNYHNIKIFNISSIGGILVYVAILITKYH